MSMLHSDIFPTSQYPPYLLRSPPILLKLSQFLHFSGIFPCFIFLPPNHIYTFIVYKDIGNETGALSKHEVIKKNYLFVKFSQYVVSRRAFLQCWCLQSRQIFCSRIRSPCSSMQYSLSNKSSLILSPLITNIHSYYIKILVMIRAPCKHAFTRGDFFQGIATITSYSVTRVNRL